MELFPEVSSYGNAKSILVKSAYILYNIVYIADEAHDNATR